MGSGIGGVSRNVFWCGGEIYGAGVAAAQQDADTFLGRGLVAAGEERGESGGSAWFDDDAKHGPKHFLRAQNFFFRNENHIVYEFLREGKHEFADASWREGVRGNSSGGAVHRASGAQSIRKSRSGLGLNADEFDLAGIPGGHAADQAAAANGDEQSIESRTLFLEFEADGSLAQQRFDLIVGVNGHGAGLRDPGLAGGQGVGIALSGDYEFRAIAANALDFFRRSHGGNEDFCGNSELAGGEGHRDPVITARSGDHTGSGNFASK